MSMAIQINVFIRGLKPLVLEMSISEHTWDSARALALLVVIWHCVYLIQLRAFNRWFSVFVFGFWTLVITLNLFTRFHQFQFPVRVTVAILTFDALNLACIFYLVRKKFRSFAVDFVIERKRERYSRILHEDSLRRIREGK
jgi:hypothetical protein